MNIGIDFNTKDMKARVLVGGSSIGASSSLFEIKNILTFANGNIFIGDDGFNKFLTEKEAVIYDLNQILELNGIIIDKKQVSVEKCLSLLFSALIEKAKSYTGTSIINVVCVAIPYDKFYLWHDIIPMAFSLIGIQKVRIISQPVAFFAHTHNDYLHERLNKENRERATKDFKEKPWYKKIFPQKSSNENSYLFVSISEDNLNVSLVEYRKRVLEIVNTQYTDTITERQIENLVLKFFLAEIGKDKNGFLIDEKKTILRVQEAVDIFLNSTQDGKYYEINLPYVLCKDGEFRTLNIKLEIENLYKSLNSKLDDLTHFIKQAASQIQKIKKIGDIVIVGELANHSYIHKFIEKSLNKLFEKSAIIFGDNKSLALGALEFSRILSGDSRDFLALEVMPFSVLVRLKGGEFIEMIKKDTIIPTTSKEQSFEIKSNGKSKFVEVHLTTREGDNFQSLNVWKIEVMDVRIFKVQVEIDANMKIALSANSEHGWKLSVQQGKTFSFIGAGFEVGIKGKDIKQYVLNQFNYLSAVLDSKEITIFEPDETFYSMLKDGEPFKALRYLGYFLKLKSLPDVEMADSKFFEEQGVGGFISGSKISVPKSFKEDSYGFGYVLAHELAHYILIHGEGIILDDEQENEILAEIFVIYMGMGKLFLNGFKSKNINLHSRGYLDDKLIQYIHQIYFNKFNINITEYQKNLTNEGKELLSKIDGTLKT